MGQEETHGFPVMLYDGDCGFCRSWIEKWRRVTGERVHYEPFQEVLAHYPQVTKMQCEKAVQLIMPDGGVFSGAHAVFKACDLAGKYRWLLRYYNGQPLFGRISEWVYDLVADHRSQLSKFHRQIQCRK